MARKRKKAVLKVVYNGGGQLQRSRIVLVMAVIMWQTKRPSATLLTYN